MTAKLKKQELAEMLIKNDYRGYYAKNGRYYIYLVTNNSKVATHLSDEAIQEIKKAKSTKSALLSAVKYEIDKSFYGTVAFQGPVTIKKDSFKL